MKKENLNKTINLSSLSEGRGSMKNEALYDLDSRGPTPKNDMQAGRTLVEMLATLSIIGLLGWGVVRVYNGIVTRVKVQNTAKMIKTLALERQNTAMSDRVGIRTKVKGPHSDLWVENGKPGNHSKYFWVETTLKDESFCKGLKESELIGADLIEINDVINGACGDNSKLAFYFKKNTSSDENLTWVDGEGNVQKCPTGSSACDSSGNATACEEGYYLSLGECERCGAHVARCEDENMPTTCAEGYELHWGACILPPQMCTMDSDCDVCATCDTETGYCQGECPQPERGCDTNFDCGRNECMICNTSTHMCVDGCTKVDYLESTGTQYIDTDYVVPHGAIIDYEVSILNEPITNNCGCGVDYGGLHFVYDRSYHGLRTGGGINSHAIPYPIGTKISIHTYYTSENARMLDALGQTYTGGYYTNPNLTAYLFATHTISGVSNSGNMRVYSSKIYNDNGDLVRDFIPVIAPNNRPAMFDKVTQKLYYNQGTGEFLTD